jgi:hypothetical protein
MLKKDVLVMTASHHGIKLHFEKPGKYRILLQGKGGKSLFLPPGHKGKVPDGYFVFHSNGYRVWAMMRGFGDVGTGDQAVVWVKKRLKVYPLATGPREHNVINTSGMGANTLPPEDGSAFEMLNEIIQLN